MGPGGRRRGDGGLRNGKQNNDFYVFYLVFLYGSWRPLDVSKTMSEDVRTFSIIGQLILRTFFLFNPSSFTKNPNNPYFSVFSVWGLSLLSCGRPLGNLRARPPSGRIGGKLG